MNSKRKAEIQRKLSMASIPKPPRGLADRIKADIPKHLSAATSDRQRHFRSMSLSLRVAASFLLLISALVVTVQLLGPEEEMKSMSVSRPAEPLTAPPAAPRVAERAIAAQAEEELRVEITQAAPLPVAAAPATATEAAPTFATARRQREEMITVEEAERAIAGNDAGVAGGVAAMADAVDATSVRAEKRQVTEMAAAPAPPPVVAAPPLPAPPSAAEQRVTVTAEAPAIAHAPSAPSPAFVREAQASALDFHARNTVFGISVDPEVFRRIKTAVESGQRPKAESVNIGALVNYFAGAPARLPKRNVALEVEASPVPVGVEGRRGMIRFTIDTAAAARGAVAPVAKDASIVIDLNEDAVTNVRPIGADATATTEDALLRGTSVTGLYEVELRPGIKERERVATITLRYRSVVDGREQVIRKELRGRDFARAWSNASRRHRLASLGALWGETLQRTSGGSDVARRAEELASQSPDDARAKELSRLATASSRMQGSGGMGSGR